MKRAPVGVLGRREASVTTPTADFTSALPAKIPTEPESPFAPVDEDGRPYMPMTLGPASRSRGPAYNPMSVEAPGIDTGTSLLAEQLNWKI